ncbi:hypothetical protein CHH61_04035 [Shouchella clausii]|uniref:DUF5983 domain-containing protein n=1 Tax=Shouchella clausii TaxID=79880 RepID=A0A268S462_SHOCL|nr:hypothetical protein [Shouchella clausii]PAF27305.1 hypothetical protein CHH61_04035 [Shouchella clausii]
MRKEIQSMLVLSTEHLPEKDRRWLDDQAQHNTDHQLVVYPKAEYGWLILVTEDSTKETIPKSIANLLQFTHSLACSWLMLDCDANTIDELPTYSE